MPPWLKGQTLDFYIKMDTIFIITIIFIVIYNTWYDLLASEDTEQNSQRLKTIWSEKELTCNPAVWLYRGVPMGFKCQPSKGLKFQRQRQKHILLPSTVKNSNQYQPSNNLKNISTLAAF